MAAFLRDRETQAGLAHARAAGNDDQVALLEATEHFVEEHKSSGNAHHPVLVAGEKVDLIDDVGHQLGERREIAVDSALADAEDEAFGPVNNIVSVVAFVVRHFGDLTGGVDQAPQSGRALDNCVRSGPHRWPSACC